MSSAVDPSLQAASAPDPDVATSEKSTTSAVELEPGAPSDVDLMLGIQSGDADALSQLYDRYNGIVKALILRIIHNDTEADDLLQTLVEARRSGELVSDRGRKIETKGTVARSSDGTVLAEATGIFMRMPDEQRAALEKRYSRTDEAFARVRAAVAAEAHHEEHART